MTRVSIQAADDIIVIDRAVRTVDCTELREAEISAVQWYGDHGEIEYAGHVKPNERFESLEAFQALVDVARPITEPEPVTPAELDAVNAAYLERHPHARKAWEERDAEMQARLAQTAEQQRQLILQQGQIALEKRNK